MSTNDLNRYQIMMEDTKAENSQLLHGYHVAIKELDFQKVQNKELVDFLEYEEAMTVDTRTQQRITTKLIELGIWPNR
jgi:hypothetical protein